MATTFYDPDYLGNTIPPPQPKTKMNIDLMKKKAQAQGVAMNSAGMKKAIPQGMGGKSNDKKYPKSKLFC